jgi:hypothetical protein
MTPGVAMDSGRGCGFAEARPAKVSRASVVCVVLVRELSNRGPRPPPPSGMPWKV